MYFSPPPIEVPSSYETLPLGHVKVSHSPTGAATATPVVVVTLNRPDKRNAFTQQMAEELERVFGLCDVDERVKAIVLTGAGHTFCAGADLEIGFSGGAKERTVDHRDRFVLAQFFIADMLSRLLQWRPRRPRHPQMPQTHHRRDAGLGRRRRHDHGAAGGGAHRAQRVQVRLRLRPPRHHHGVVLVVLSPAADRLLARHVPRLNGRRVPADLAAFRRAVCRVAGRPGRGAAARAGVGHRDRAECQPHGVDAEPGADVAWACVAGRGASARVEHYLPYVWGRVCCSFSGRRGCADGCRDQKEGVTAFFEKRKPNFKATLEENGPANYPWWYEASIEQKAPAAKKSKL